MKNREMLRQYQERLTLYQHLRDELRSGLEALITQAELNIHQLTARVKTAESLSDKLRRKPGRYDKLHDVTDLVALRVITYLESDVNVVARLIEEHFQIDWSNSSDKSMHHDPDRFGYMGVHYVVYAKNPDLPDMRFEVQIRSILQHAWAEIEHDLGYKSRDAVPREVRRRFYRLAGLLEMADEEFMTIHRLSRDYAATLPYRIIEAPDSVFIDSASMKVLIEAEPIRDLDEVLADILDVPLLQDWRDPERPNRLASLLHLVEVHSVGFLIKDMTRQADDIVAFGAATLPQMGALWQPSGGLRPGVSVVQYVLWRICAVPLKVSTGQIYELLGTRGTGLRDDLVKLSRQVYEQQHTSKR